MGLNFVTNFMGETQKRKRWCANLVQIEKFSLAGKILILSRKIPPIVGIKLVTEFRFLVEGCPDPLNSELHKSKRKKKVNSFFPTRFEIEIPKLYVSERLKSILWQWRRSWLSGSHMWSVTAREVDSSYRRRYKHSHARGSTTHSGSIESAIIKSEK